MKIKYTKNNDAYEVEINDYIEIIADNGQKLYQVTLHGGTALEIFSGLNSVRHEGKRYSFQLIAKPENTNEITIQRERYE